MCQRIEVKPGSTIWKDAIRCADQSLGLNRYSYDGVYDAATMTHIVTDLDTGEIVRLNPSWDLHIDLLRTFDVAGLALEQDRLKKTIGALEDQLRHVVEKYRRSNAELVALRREVGRDSGIHRAMSQTLAQANN